MINKVTFQQLPDSNQKKILYLDSVTHTHFWISRIHLYSGDLLFIRDEQIISQRTKSVKYLLLRD